MQTREIDMNSIENYMLKNGYHKAWVQETGSVYLGELKEFKWDEKQILEARVFDGQGKEIHIFDYEGILKAIETITENTDQKIDSNQLIILDANEKSVHYFDSTQLLRKKAARTTSSTPCWPFTHTYSTPISAAMSNSCFT